MLLCHFQNLKEDAVNLFHAAVFFLYPCKTPENRGIVVIERDAWYEMV